MKYTTIIEDVEYKKDNNCCTVVASAVAFDKPFHVMHKIYKDNGRVNKRGLGGAKAIKMVEKLADRYNVEVKHFMPRMYNLRGKSMTANNCTNYLDAKYNYVLFTSRHAIGISNNKVEDFTRGKRHKIQYIMQISKPVEAVSITVENPLQRAKELLKLI